MTVHSADQFPTEVPAALLYETPTLRMGSPTTAAALISFLGLGLILLGGCFLIGVLISSSSPNADDFAHKLLAVVLYAVAFACFGGAVGLLVIGVGRLIKIARG